MKFRQSLLAVTLSLLPLTLASPQSQSSPPPPPLWGGALQWSSLVNFSDPGDSPLPDPTWQFTYHYDSINSSEIYLHGPNNGDMVCINTAHYPPGDPCNVLTSSDGRTYITHIPSGECCISPHHYGMLNPDWLINSNATYNGTDNINGVDSYEWACMGSVNGINNYASTTSEGREPVAFWEEHKGAEKRWDFILDSYVVGAPDPGVFEVPEGCVKYCPIF
ncbi:hypothetical protein TrVE_jg5914 [Triparma verrucosa]|uniref:Uncharacterized protein n=1 Tax=Triparma verrucosa TaxID=1606542 RepID=A0A9W7CCY7_9STRA|nr:hypothetical protein TrVE_jg5914 [Triparma verrucosa]